LAHRETEILREATMTSQSLTGDDRRQAQYTSATPGENLRTVLVNRVSWGAIIAGAVIALIVQFLLSLLGVGIGTATLHPATGNNPDAATFSMVSAIWYAITGIIAAFAGGFIASRLSGRPLASTGALHGLTSRAVTTLVLLYLLTTAIGGLIGGALSGLGAIAGGIGNTVSTVAQTAAPGVGKRRRSFCQHPESDHASHRRNRPEGAADRSRRRGARRAHR
jgi:hypothetical protein